jgi:hypothetical protein
MVAADLTPSLGSGIEHREIALMGLTGLFWPTSNTPLESAQLYSFSDLYLLHGLVAHPMTQP